MSVPDGRDDGRRERLRFEDVEFEAYQDGRCRVTVALEWDGSVFRGEATGTQTLQGSLRTGAQATLRAAEEAAAGRLVLTLVGIKAVRAFDAWVVVASVQGQSDAARYKLLGSEACEDEDMIRASVRTILSATNRVLEKYVRPEG